MEVIVVRRGVVHKRAVVAVAHTLQDGGVVLVPGDTSYLLAIQVGNKKALERLNKIKKQPKRKYYSVMLKDFGDIAHYTDISNVQYRVMKRALPGPYTFIVKASREIPKIMLQKRKEIGIRMPDNPFMQALLEEISKPLLVTTAHVDNRDFFEDPDEQSDGWENCVDFLIDAGMVPAELTSIIDMSGDEWEVKREGKGDTSLL
ncbi:threonylcarbamoyl-AMP synthase [bacterium]|nr:threonylcarbamoyl-AMP synthase [bacterium]